MATLAQDHASQRAAITSLAEKIGCAAETLRSWVRQASAYLAKAELDRRAK
jgi:transposase-like protein